MALPMARCRSVGHVCSWRFVLQLGWGVANGLGTGCCLTKHVIPGSLSVRKRNENGTERQSDMPSEHEESFIEP